MCVEGNHAETKTPSDNMKTISFKASKQEYHLIGKIAKRASKLASSFAVDYSVATANMDISACHANGNPLDLEALLAADDGNFGHDVFGIRRHINRSTGELGDCFVPRFSARN